MGCAVSSQVFCKRLRPDQDLRLSLKQWAEEENLQAASVVSAVGSLKSAEIRLADGKTATHFEGPFEIVSLTGTVSKGGLHLHISLADKTGKTIGGHLLEGSKIYTTAEITLLEATQFQFSREKDNETGYEELVIRKR